MSESIPVVHPKAREESSVRKRCYKLLIKVLSHVANIDWRRPKITVRIGRIGRLDRQKFQPRHLDRGLSVCFPCFNRAIEIANPDVQRQIDLFPYIVDL